MSTDNEMDDLLQSAGQRWRAANPTQAPTVDFATVAPLKSGRRPSRWMIITSAAAVVVAVAVGGTWLGTRTNGGNPKQASGVASSLTGIEWHVYGVTLHQGNSDNDVPSYGTSATLKFSTDGTFSGSDGVNSVAGPYHADGSTIHFGDVAVSAVGTTNTGLGRTASAIDSILQGDVTWSVRPDDKAQQLVIDHAGVGELNLLSVDPTTVGQAGLAELTGTEWSIFEVTNETSNSASSINADGSKALISISPDGELSGSDGCNALSGRVTMTPTTITIPALGTTFANCLGQVGKIASVIDDVLQGTSTWTVSNAGDGNDLSIEHAGVGSLIFFGPKPAAPPVSDPSKLARTWVLVEYGEVSSSSGQGGVAPSPGSGGSQGLGVILVIDADGTFKIQHRCYANSGKVLFGDATATWSDVHLDGSIPCPSISNQKDEQHLDALVDGVLSGTTQWSFDADDQLSLSKGGDSLTFVAYSAHSNGPSGSPTN